jgi:hypothetical protein
VVVSWTCQTSVGRRHTSHPWPQAILLPFFLCTQLSVDCPIPLFLLRQVSGAGWPIAYRYRYPRKTAGLLGRRHFDSWGLYPHPLCLTEMPGSHLGATGNFPALSTVRAGNSCGLPPERFRALPRPSRHRASVHLAERATRAAAVAQVSRSHLGSGVSAFLRALFLDRVQPTGPGLRMGASPGVPWFGAGDWLRRGRGKRR